MRLIWAMLLFTFLSLPAMAQEKALQLDLANKQVDITTGFDGSSIVLFGTTSPGVGQSLFVTLKGPERTVIVRRKERTISGAWANRDNIEFRRVPSYYDYAVTGNMTATESLLRENQIGVDNLDFYAENDNEEDEAGLFRDALIRTMQQKGFFPIKAGSLQFIGENFFKVIFELPPGVPTGIYTAEAVLIRDGVVLSKESRNLQVGQVGFNARVYLFAQDNSLLYGIMAVLLAAISGWSAFTFLRRD
jgi:uncharacterized protein (TIGR02186 family)